VLDLGGGKPEEGDRRWGRSFGEAPMVGGTGEPIPAEEEVGRPRGGAVENEGDSVELTWGLNRVEEVRGEELGGGAGRPVVAGSDLAGKWLKRVRRGLAKLRGKARRLGARRIKAGR